MSTPFSRLIHTTGKAVKWFLGITGCITLLAFLISFTDIPFNAWYRLGTPRGNQISSPGLIVILSGSGMPSPDGLMSAYQGARTARQYPDAKIIVALPSSEEDNFLPLRLLANELIIRGVDSSRILFEPLGFNTRSQALQVAARYPGKDTLSVLLITTPEHLYRSVRTFRKVGFKQVGGSAAFDKPIDPDKAMDQGKSKDLQVRSLALRYNMWSYLHYELLVIREYCAIAYYRIKGWI